MKLAGVAVVVLVLALVPVAFWLAYGTMDACTAFRQSLAKQTATTNGGFAGALAGLAVSGAVGIGRLSGRECLDALWTLETEGPDAAMKAVEDALR